MADDDRAIGINDNWLPETTFADGTLATLVDEFRAPEEQHQRWEVAAYFHWIERRCPIGEDRIDWFATEPIA